MSSLWKWTLVIVLAALLLRGIMLAIVSDRPERLRHRLPRACGIHRLSHIVPYADDARHWMAEITVVLEPPDDRAEVGFCRDLRRTVAWHRAPITAE
jgi:hypothetical protein